MAILLVVASHAILIGPNGAPIGVTLFFVLSGFLITNLLLIEHSDNGAIDLVRFYARRGMRLLPALILFLVGSAVVMSLLHEGFPVWRVTWAPLLYVANYAQLLGVDLLTNHHTWSLAVEEHFYLVWPLLIAIIPSARRLRILGIAMIGLVAWRFFIGGIDVEWARLSSDTNAYALVLGALFATLYRRGVSWTAPRHLGEVMVAGLLLLSVAPILEPGVPGVWLPVVAALLSLVAVASCVLGENPLLEASWLRLLGAVSYGWYLWHGPLLFDPSTNNTQSARLAIAVGSLLIAWLSWRFFESPLLALRGRKTREQAADRTEPTERHGRRTLASQKAKGSPDDLPRSGSSRREA